MLIRFTHDAVYETEGPGKGPRFKAGEVHDMRDDLAMRWVNRNVAQLHVPEEPASPAPAEEPGEAPVAERAALEPVEHEPEPRAKRAR